MLDVRLVYCVTSLIERHCDAICSVLVVFLRIVYCLASQTFVLMMLGRECIVMFYVGVIVFDLFRY